MILNCPSCGAGFEVRSEMLKRFPGLLDPETGGIAGG